MEKAKAAVANFTSRHGHTTDVEEVVRPAVVAEEVKPHRHEDVIQAVDREVHQHHHHTTVQPLKAREVLPEKHLHNVVPIEEREFHHENEEETRARLAREAAKFKDTTTVLETHHTQAAAPTVTGEHVHHHVHETVQPIVLKETIKPEVVHTVVPIHETHISATQHHGMSKLPMKTLEEFTAAGGVLTGNKSAAHETYEGPPRPYNKELQTDLADLDLNRRGHRQTDSGVGGVGSSNADTSNFENKVDPRVDGDRNGTSGLGHTAIGDTSYMNAGVGNTSGEADPGNYGNDLGESTSRGSTGKPSLAARLNPFKDT